MTTLAPSTEGHRKIRIPIVKMGLTQFRGHSKNRSLVREASSDEVRPHRRGEGPAFGIDPVSVLAR